MSRRRRTQNNGNTPPNKATRVPFAETLKGLGVSYHTVPWSRVCCHCGRPASGVKKRNVKTRWGNYGAWSRVCNNKNRRGCRRAMRRLKPLVPVELYPPDQL